MLIHCQYTPRTPSLHACRRFVRRNSKFTDRGELRACTSIHAGSSSQNSTTHSTTVIVIPRLLPDIPPFTPPPPSLPSPLTPLPPSLPYPPHTARSLLPATTRSRPHLGSSGVMLRVMKTDSGLRAERSSWLTGARFLPWTSRGSWTLQLAPS